MAVPLSRDRGSEHVALGHEFTLYLLRNPDERERVAANRSEVVEALAEGGRVVLSKFSGMELACAGVDLIAEAVPLTQ